MKNVRSKQGSRMNNYQTSDQQDDDDYGNNHARNDSPQFDNEDPDQIQILFDPNEALSGFGNPSKQAAGQEYMSSPYNNNFDDHEGEKMGSGDSSGFYDHEDAFEQPMAEPKNFSNAQTASEAPTDFEEVDKGFHIQNENYFKEEAPAPSSINSYIPDAPSSYANYQIGSVARAAQKRKPPPMKNKLVNQNASRSNKPEILHMENEDIGEVGEWVGRSANVNIKNEDSDNDEDEQRNNSDDFEGVFEQTEPRGQRAPAANSRKAPPHNNRFNEDDEEEEERGERPYVVDNAVNLAEQSNRAMQKAQDSALRAARNKGPFMNNLKAKAQNLRTKTNDEIAAVADGDIKLKKEAQKINIAEEEDDLEDVEAALSGFGSGTQQSRKEHKVEQTQKYNPPAPAQEKNEFNDRPKAQEHKSPNKSPERDEKPQGLDDILNMQSPNKSEKASPVDEWEAISKVTAQQANQKARKEDVKLVTFDEAWEIVKNLNLSEQKKKVQQEMQGSQGFLQKMIGSCSGGTLPAPLLEERDHVLALAKVPFNEDEPLYFTILQTIYVKLTGKMEPVPRFGPHWELIGFQGRDPATDLRGVGVLGLIQLLAFLSSNEKLFKKMFQHSIHDKYNFPLSICGFSITQSVMEVLRAGRINSSIKAKKSVILALNEVYFATFYKLFNIYELNSYTIQDYPKAKMTAIGLLKANPTALINEYNKYAI